MRHKGHNFTSYKVVVGALLLAIAPLGFAEAPALPDFIVSASPAAIRVARNAKGSAIVSTTIFHGFNRSVNLTAAGLPKGAAASFSRSAVAGSGELSSALTISVGNHTPLGTYSVTVSGSAGGDRKSATVTLTVEPSQGLPTGYGWHQLPNTSMTSVCLGNVPNGMYTDDTMTTTTNYTFNCLQVTPFSGGAADDNNQRLIVWGGGHRDYAGNEVSVLNLNGTPSWQALTGPTYPVPAVSGKYAWEGLQPYFVSAADGGVYQPGASPSSRHTFNSLQYVPYQNKLYSFGGSVANLGYFSQETWALDLAAKAWTLVGPPFSQAPAYPTTAYNPTNGHIVMHDKIWSLLDFDPNTGNWTTLTSQYHIEDGTTAAIDPINNLFVVVDSGGSSNGTSYPSVASYHTVLVFPLTPPYAMQTWSDPSCDLPYRNGGLAWDSALGLMVGYPGGGNQVYLLNTGAQDVVTPFGTVPSHKCLDVPISLNPSPVKGVDYPQDPEGSLNGSNWGIYGRFRYFPSLDTFVVMNDRTKNVWTLQLAGGSPAPNFAVSTSPGTLTVPEGSQGTSVISTTVSGGFNNPITLSTAGVPAGTTVSFAPSTIAAPGAGSSTLTINVGASTPAGTYPIVVSAFGGGDTANTSVTLTVSASGPPNFTISALPASLSISQGNQAISTITSTISGVFNSAISLSASGAPLGTTVSFIPNPISAPGAGSSTMTIAVGNNTPTGTYPITVTGNGGGIQQTTTVTLTVTAGAQPNFTISASPASFSIPQGNQGTSTITTNISSGFNSAISLSASGVPSGTTVSFAPSTIPAPGAGNSTMTVTVGSGTPAGAYPITVTGNGGGIQQNATISLTVTAPPAYDVGIDFRSSQNYVTDPAYAVFDNCVNDGITPQTRTNSNGYSVTWQWSQKCNAAADQSNTIDPRLAGMASVYNASGGEALTITVPQPGTYNIGFATGSATGNECGGGKCANFIFKDGASGTQLFTVNPNNPGTAHFIDAANNNWTAAQWPASNQEQQVTLTGTTLTLSMAAGNGANIAHIRLTSVPPKGFTLSASPASLSIAQGNQGTSTITTTINNGFSDSISLSASGTPSGTTVSFSPNPIPVPGAGSSTMSVTVGGNTPTGTYPITVTGNGGGIQQTTMVTLTVSAGAQPDFVLTVLPTQVFVPQGLAGSATVTTWLVGSFNNSISLSASGAPSGTTVSFNPSTIPAPGSGNSTVTLTVASNTPTGNYPITLTGNGGGKQHTATLNLTVTPQAAFTLSASPASLSIQQGNQGTSTITSTISGGFNSAISLSASGAPSGTTVSFNPNPISAPGSGNSTMTITVGAGTPTGTYPITVTGNGGGIQQNTTVTLTVTAAPTFTITASPASLSVQQGNQGTSIITATISGGFNSAISLSASGAPSGTTVSFSPNPIPAPGSGNSTMTITVAASTPTGTYPIKVTGNGGGIQQSTTVTLTVTAGAQPNFSISASPASLSIPQGNQAASTITTAVSGGFNSAISLSASGMPSGTTVSFNPSTIPAPGAGSSTMTITVGSSTPTGTYPITITGNGGGIQQSTTVSLTVTTPAYDVGIDFRSTQNYVTDPAYAVFDNCINDGTSQQTRTNSNGYSVTWQWSQKCNAAADQSKSVDPRLAGTGNTYTASGGETLTITVPQPGTYNIGFATGSATGNQCGGGKCPNFIFKDGVSGSQLFTVNPNNPGSGNFIDAANKNWTAAQWPSSNQMQPVTLTGTKLTVSMAAGNAPSIAHIRITYVQQQSFSLSASPASLSVAQGNQGTSTITAAISGGFNSSISLSASGIPSGTTVSFNPNPIPAPGSGGSTMTITIGASTPVGTYPITVTGNGGGVQQNTTVTLTVTAQQQPNFTISASPASLSVQQGNQGNSTITTTISGGFNSAISLSASGAPSGTTVSFNPSTIPAPGGGSSTMTITVGSSTPTGTYPVTVTGNGGGMQQNATVSLTVTSSGGGGRGGNGIIVYSTSGLGQTNRFVSIGRFFKQGDIPDFAQAVVGGTALLTQCDVKNRWGDGSLKFGIISFIIPNVSTSGTQVTFQDQGTGNNTGYLAQGDMLNAQYDFDGVMQLTGTSSPSISARSMLQAGQFRYWLQGPIVTAVILEDRNGRSFDVNTDGASGNPLHPIFEAWYYPQTNQVELGFTLENSWASSTAASSARNQTYAMTLTTGFNSPTTQLTQSSFTQIIFSRWRRSFWIDSAPAPIQINYNWPYLASTKAYANFNPNYTPNESDLESMYSVYTNEPAGRLTIPGIDQVPGNGGIVNYDQAVNAPGYAPWIGPYSQWDVDYLMTGDSRMQQMMTDNADLSGRFPIFFREGDHNAGTGHYFDAPNNGSVDPYGHVVSINARQQATLNLFNWNVACNGGLGADAIATSLPGDGSGWYAVPADTSHMPDFAYVPYTLTGKYFYLEHEMLEAGFVAGHGVGCSLPDTWPSNRHGHYGMLYSTTRELAWALRTMAYAAFIAPDGTPEGPYFASKVINNIAMIEGEHALTQTVSGADPNWAYNWGKNYFVLSQAANPSPLSFWRMGDCQDGTTTCYVAGGNGANNNINSSIVQSAESAFMSSFIDIVLGLTNQLGIVDTTSILQRNARRYFNILLNPAVNHYLVEQYVYPTTLVGTICQNPANPGCVWISDWGTFQSGYLTLPTGWSNREVDFGAEAASALSFMTKFTVDGYNGLDAWNFFTTSDATQLGLVYHNEPQWSIQPMQ